METLTNPNGERVLQMFTWPEWINDKGRRVALCLAIGQQLNTEARKVDKAMHDSAPRIVVLSEAGKVRTRIHPEDLERFKFALKLLV